MTSGLIPERAAIAVADLLDNCAQVQPGQHVLLLCAQDGLYGGRNLVDEQAITSTSGKRIPCQVDSICVHGDGPNAVEVIAALRRTIGECGHSVAPLAGAASAR